MSLRPLQTPAYSNWLMLGPDGSEMCRCAEKRARWYLDRGLADVIGEDPPTIKLKFDPQGPGNQGDEFSLAPKLNRCVVCGTEEDLTKHHIVPSMYRKFFPVEIKSRSAHDVVVICIKCHDEYEAVATKLKSMIGIEYDARDNVAPLTQEQRNHNYLVKLCKTLRFHGKVIPSDRHEEIIAMIVNLLGRDISDEEIQELSESTTSTLLNRDTGRIVVEKILASDLLDSFVLRWRQHFIDTAQPRFMPDHWSVQRKIS